MDNHEVLQSTTEDRQGDWVTRVWEACGGKCSNCGSEDHLRVEMIVPIAAGGKKVVSNGVLLCRVCELARKIGLRSVSPVSGEHTRPINFFVSQALYGRLKNGLGEAYGFHSVASLVRFLMLQFVEDPGRYDDLRNYQDGGSPDVKVNVWINKNLYSSFKAITDREGVTVTETLKGLIRMYESETQRFVGSV